MHEQLLLSWAAI